MTSAKPLIVPAGLVYDSLRGRHCEVRDHAEVLHVGRLDDFKHLGDWLEHVQIDGQNIGKVDHWCRLHFPDTTGN